MTAPDPGLTDLIAAHQESGQGRWLAHDGVYMRCRCGETMHPIHWPAHVALVVEPHATVGSKQWRAMFRANLERAEKAEATIARVEKALAEGPLHRIDFPRSKDPYGIERQTIRAALEGEQQ